MSSAHRLAPLIVVVLAILAGIHAIDPSPVGVFYDDAHYVILGRALSLGEGYRYINVPGAPAATHFPPGYPALLAILWRISPVFPENVALFKMVNALLLGGIALGVYHAARQLLDARALSASLTALASTAAIPALLLSSSVMSEVLFLAFLLPLLVAADRALERGSGTRVNALLLGLAAGSLCLIRTHGVVLIPALAIGYARRRRFADAAIMTAAAALVLAPWLLWVRHYDPLVPASLRGQYASYGSWLAEGLRANGAGLLVTSLRDNLATSYAIVARSFSVARHAVPDALAVLAVLVLLGAGAFALARRATVTLSFVALYLAIVLVWPFSPLRFLWGIWPLLVLLMVGGGAALWRGGEHAGARRTVRALAIGASAVVLVGALNFNVRGYVNSWWATVSRSFAPRIQPQLVWVTEKTGHTDVIVADDEGAVYLYTGRRAVPPNTFTVEQYFRPRSTEENARWLSAIVRAFDPAYVVAWAQPTLDAAVLLSSRQPPLLVQVDSIPTGRVYRRAPAQASP